MNKEQLKIKWGLIDEYTRLIKNQTDDEETKQQIYEIGKKINEVENA